jgi:hypothetical protein
VTDAPRHKPESLIAELEGLGITRGIVRQMVAVGQIIELRCEMPKCYYHKGRRSFEMKRHPPARWQLSVDHYPILARDGGRLDPWNVRLGHVLCNRYDYGWRVRIRTMLEKGKSLKAIAEGLNRKGIRRPHGSPRWTAASVRQAFVS